MKLNLLKQIKLISSEQFPAKKETEGYEKYLMRIYLKMILIINLKIKRYLSDNLDYDFKSYFYTSSTANEKITGICADLIQNKLQYIFQSN